MKLPRTPGSDGIRATDIVGRTPGSGATRKAMPPERRVTPTNRRTKA